LLPGSNAIPNARIAAAAACLLGALGCGSAVFYEEDPSGIIVEADEPPDRWLDAPALAPGPSWDDGLSCQDSVAIARVRVLGGLDTAKALGDHDRQRCLGRQAALLSTLAGMIAREDETESACRAAHEVFIEANGCGG
jgi:hypothetical protein